MIEENTKRSLWENHFQAWRESGLSITRWCNENKVNPSTFYYWKNVVEPIKQAKNTKKTQWIEVKSHKKTEKKAPVETLQLKYHDFTLYIPTKFDKTSLIKVISTLRALC
jgi:hypothetical protein